MLSARAYSFRQKSRLAISLSWIAGYTNTATLLLLGTTSSHVTGNVTHFGEHLVRLDWSQAAFFGFLMLCFLVGAAMSGLMTESARRRAVRSKYILPMAVEALLLALVAIGINQVLQDGASSAAIYWISGLASGAMGLQNATITFISGSIIRTTHLTGVMTDLGLEGMQLLLWYRDRLRWRGSDRKRRLLRISQRHPTVLRVLLLASIIASFLFGVVAGALVMINAPFIALAPPVLFLIWIIFVDWWWPIADLRELDLFSDPELKMFGIVKSLLPDELALYRLSHHRADAQHRPPSFEHWVDRLPERARVIVLALSPFTRLDSNAILDLRQAIERMLRQSRRLVIAGVRPAQYKALDVHGVTDLLAVEDFAPDMEFAIARALELVRQIRGENSTLANPEPAVGQRS